MNGNERLIRMLIMTRRNYVSALDWEGEGWEVGGGGGGGGGGGDIMIDTAYYYVNCYWQVLSSIT